MNHVGIRGKVFPKERKASAQALTQEGPAWSAEGPAETQLQLVESWQVAGGDVRVSGN